MENGVVLGFCENEKDRLSPEEKDNLLRSTKKPKVQEETEETPSPPVQKQAHMGDALFETNTSMRLRKKVVSYKDIILGVNGDSSEDSGSEGYATEEENESEEISSSEGEEKEKHSGTSDPLCPKVHISNEEHRNACKQWKKSVIIKVLGKKVRCGFLYLRLTKLWNPRGGARINRPRE
ncbi:hypothetical protein SESBI_12147 [Sesbania bispinosa]|nr:hypothetical protein SESBI_12147 [Sesbania bispinosa]